MANPAEIVDLDAARKEAKRKYQREYMREWIKKNPEKHRASSREAMTKQRENRPEAVKKSKKRSYSKEWASYACSRAKKRAEKDGTAFAIGVKDIIIPAFCPVLGIRIEISTRAFSDSSPSLDRINPMLGYVPGNIAVISMRANAIKRNGTAAEHDRIAAWMRANGVA